MVGVLVCGSGLVDKGCIVEQISCLFSLGQFAFCRAVINFNNPDDVILFKEKFDDYIFVDPKGWCTFNAEDTESNFRIFFIIFIITL